MANMKNAKWWSSRTLIRSSEDNFELISRDARARGRPGIDQTKTLVITPPLRMAVGARDNGSVVPVGDMMRGRVR